MRFVAQAFQVWQNLAFARCIERSQRFIQQQQPRAHQQSPADRDALTLAAGKFAGPSIEQMADVEQFDRVTKCRRIRRVAAHPAAVIEISLHREMRKQPAFLKHIAYAPPRGRHIDARFAVKKNIIVEHNATAVRRQQPGDHIDDAGLAGAGLPEQGGGATFADE